MYVATATAVAITCSTTDLTSRRLAGRRERATSPARATASCQSLRSRMAAAMGRIWNGRCGRQHHVAAGGFEVPLVRRLAGGGGFWYFFQTPPPPLFAPPPPPTPAFSRSPSLFSP